MTSTNASKPLAVVTGASSGIGHHLAHQFAWFTDPFFPFAHIPSGTLSNDELAALAAECPQTPPSDGLWAN
ncbi:MAG: hypothetical protein M3492_14205 [Actinomycetota bacterium]|nr:hypothetical protein [Actinomycetota bacterium]